jgi:hypothetical protein
MRQRQPGVAGEIERGARACYHAGMSNKPAAVIVRSLVTAHVCLSLGGLLTHLRWHPPADSLYYWWAAPMAGVSAVVLPFLFLRASLVGWGCLLNAAAVTVGVVGMLYYSLLTHDGPLTWSALLLTSQVASVVILLAKLPLAHAILVVTRAGRSPRAERGCRP